MAEAVPTRSSSRRASAPAAPEETGAPLTRAELRRRAAAQAQGVETAPTADAPAAAAPEISVAESVVADVAAAIIGETVGAEPDPAARRRLREAAGAVFAHVAEHDVEAEVAESPAAEAHEASTSAFVDSEPYHLDEFEFAARLFSFTGETPVQRTAESTATAADEQPAPVSASAFHVAPARPRRGRVVFQRVAAASFSIGVMTIVGLLAVGTTTPAAAVASATSTRTTDLSAPAKAATSDSDGTIQAFVTSGSKDGTALDRPEGYNVASMSEIAAESGVTIFAGTWVNNPSAPIQWPFPVGVPISAAYGSSSYLAEFSSAHSGVDLT
ncbi:MAG TPA: M23 family peptidase, partial [Microbacterium sp.]|nr:M23 family peptidase [Microbacterium sp.]